MWSTAQSVLRCLDLLEASSVEEVEYIEKYPNFERDIAWFQKTVVCMIDHQLLFLVAPMEKSNGFSCSNPCVIFALRSILAISNS